MHRKWKGSWKGMLRRGTGCALAALVTMLWMPTAAGAAQDKPAPAKTLYQRMGGYDTLAGIIGDFIDRLKSDHAFDRFGGGRSANSLGRTKQLVVDQVCWMTGGPCFYIGRDMKTAHEGLKITEAEWESSTAKLKAALDKFKIAEPEQTEFLAMIGKLKPDIVEKKAADEKPAAQN